jgi:hypothetical protein
MAKKKAKKTLPAPAPAAPGARQGASPEGDRGGEAGNSRWLWVAAVIFILAGYFLLHKVDPAGQNAWGIVSPALLLTGYLLIIPAIIVSYRR